MSLGIYDLVHVVSRILKQKHPNNFVVDVQSVIGAFETIVSPKINASVEFSGAFQYTFDTVCIMYIIH